MLVPDGVERIGTCWFWDCDLESAEIPASVTEIDAHAFYNCKRLIKITFRKGKIGTTESGENSRRQKT